MSDRYVVRRELPMLWTILDRWTLVTEFVLFGERGGNYVRYWAHDELLPTARGAILEEMVDIAARAGIRHTLRLPRDVVMVEAPLRA